MKRKPPFDRPCFGGIALSFSSKAKEELCRLRIQKACCARAALSAWAHMAGSLQIGHGMKLRLVTESYAVARWGVQLAKKCYPIEAEIYVREHKRLGKNRSFSIAFSGDALPRMLEETSVIRHGEGGIELPDSIDAALIENDCCKRAFLRGAFIGAGSVSDPQKSYHLEFVVRSAAMRQALSDTLAAYELNAKSVLRKDSHVVYLKESDKITDFLTLIGAHGTLLDLENVRAFKDFRNDLNRKVNCETANLQKMATASARQLENIRFLLEENALASQPPELQQAAQLRLNHPDVTLSELGELLTPPIGKSGVNHRLRRLDALAQQLRREKEEAHGSQSIENR